MFDSQNIFAAVMKKNAKKGLGIDNFFVAYEDGMTYSDHMN